MSNLFKHVWNVQEGDSFEEALKKMRAGIKSQTNQALSRFQLYQQMPQSRQTFGQWDFKVKEQAYCCDWTGYHAKNAARDAILFETDNKKLMKKIVAEDIDYDETIKVGLSMKQGDKKVEEMRGKNHRKEEGKFLGWTR